MSIAEVLDREFRVHSVRRFRDGTVTLNIGGDKFKVSRGAVLQRRKSRASWHWSSDVDGDIAQMALAAAAPSVAP